MTTEVAKQLNALRERAERELAQRSQVGQIRIQIGSATCENAAGARELIDEFQKHIRACGRTDIVLHRTGCTGRCSCEPIVGVLVPGQMAVKYQRVDRARAHEIFTSHVLGGEPLPKLMLDAQAGGTHRYEFFFCGADRCLKSHEKDYPNIFREKLKAAGISQDEVAVLSANCFGLCGGDDDNDGTATRVLVRPGKTIYRVANEADLDDLIQQHIRRNQVVERLRINAYSITGGFFDLYGDVSFFNQQTRLALRNSGVIDPESLPEYIMCKGFSAMATVLEKGDPEWVIEEMTQSKLRGRGGGGYPTGLKWKSAAAEPGDTKYIICNADEGDPGAFMDRSMLEGDPLSVIEGMIIGGYAIGAHRGFFYVRAEYPLAVRRIETGLRLAREWGLLGKNILGSGFDFDLEIRLGAGAFVCGEETALIHSIEGQRGQPRIRPPYPAKSGLWDKPTIINNVETFANVPVVIQYGADWFKRIGTEKSGGTKVFALAGKVRHTGLVEVPMGSTLREIVFDIGGGPPGGRKLKAIQTGGPAGGCIRADFMDTPVDFDTLMKAGSIMGSGGMIVMDESDCMVDIAKFFLTFSQNESCGKCTPCREGTKRMLEILEKITTGRATPLDLTRLERLAQLVQKTSLCGLGRAAPNPVLSTLRYFRSEYEAHVNDRRCPALRCVALVSYKIDAAKCVGCTVCARRCPATCITGERRQAHVIDELRCIKCGQCFAACRFQAVTRN
jgi:NADH:ubiquinone oxidoreductase subunit F (NADH-binding)/(2Fe-2S) ferredoxin/NAD-dependent dihydropyrimidine dehydrogenase PreA subunit